MRGLDQRPARRISRPHPRRLALEPEARQLLNDKMAGIPDSLEGRTIVIEFARGGPQNSSMPLTPPYGYQYSFGRLSDHILGRAAILYIWVTPEESRRKNEERAKPGRDDCGWRNLLP